MSEGMKTGGGIRQWLFFECMMRDIAMADAFGL